MSRKRKVTSPLGLGEISATPVKMAEGYETRRQFYERLEREEKAAAARAKEAEEAPLKAAQREYSKNLVALRKAQAEALFINPSEYLTENCTHLPEDINSTPEQVTKDIREAFDTLRLELSERGVTINPVGMEKIRRVVELNSSIDITKVENWRVLYSHLDDLNVFTDRDRTVIESKPVVQPKPSEKPSLDRLLETVSGETREGRALLAEAVMETAIAEEYRPCWQAFTESLYRNFNGFVLSEPQRRLFYDTMVKWNCNFNRPKDFDRVRVAMCKNGDLPGLLYESEKLDIEMEKADLNNLEVRREFARRSRQLTEQRSR